jgi:hypothetical protein
VQCAGTGKEDLDEWGGMELGAALKRVRWLQWHALREMARSAATARLQIRVAAHRCALASFTYD